jgi:1-hydroxycarotenoid 3,4-desaturase
VRAVVVGAGVGGLVAAALLARRGLDVTVFEAADGPGGKAGRATVDGVTFDTGPSVVTLPDVFEAVFTELGRPFPLTWTRPAFRYAWPDGVGLVAGEDPVADVIAAWGGDAGRELATFLDYARGIWEAAGPRFVRGPAPSAASFLSLAALRDLPRIDPLRTLVQGVDARVREPHLRDLLLRFATYNGSDPRRAPATLNCIAWVELGLGAYGVQGGIAALVDALEDAARGVGVGFRYGAPVDGLVRDGRAVVGVTMAGARVPADVVVANAEAATVARWLGRTPEPPSSTSGWTAVVRVPRRPREGHTVLFPAVYAEEFVDLFDRARPPEDPTVYVCAPGVAHGNPGWPTHEPLFLMANAPVEPEAPRSVWPPGDVVRHGVLARLAAVEPGPVEVVWERSPAGLAARFPGSRGALYGAASNGPTAAFRRPANRVPGVTGLYLASGSAHPGGGLPLVALSGRAAADAVTGG